MDQDKTMRKKEKDYLQCYWKIRSTCYC